MRRIELFCEDAGHQRFLRALIIRLARELGVRVELRVRLAAGGRGRVQSELRRFVRELANDPVSAPDLIVVATDANCRGNQWRNELAQIVENCPSEVIFAVPDPHVERWLLLDSGAFRVAVGRGCSAPDQKCDKDRYKQRLREAVADAGLIPELGGLEHTQAIVEAMDLDRLSHSGDSSLARLLTDLRRKFTEWCNEQPIPSA